jgi:hypothetical protein
MDTEPSLSADVLLSSSFAQEQYITIPAQQLFHSPGIYMLQVSCYNRGFGSVTKDFIICSSCVVQNLAVQRVEK